MVVIVGQGRLYVEVHHRCVANAVPSRLHGNATHAFLFEAVTRQLYLYIVLHFHTIALCRRDGDVVDGVDAVRQPFTILVDEGHTIGVIGQDVAVLPWEAAQQGVDVAEVIVIDVQRNPVPSFRQLQFLDVELTCLHDHRILYSTNNLARSKLDDAVGLEHHGLACLVVP